MNNRLGALFRVAAATAATGASVAALGGGSAIAASSHASPHVSSQQVTFALDWTPNTDHLGVYVAQELGYFAKAGIQLKIIPYGSTNPTDLIASGAADFGIAGEPDVEVGRSAGQDLKFVYGVTQGETGDIVVLPSEHINSPKQLDGKVFGGFGEPLYSDIARTVIKNAGGTGDFTEVTLDTDAYSALSSGKIGFTESVATWENIQQQLEGKPYKVFRYQSFGVPNEQTIGIASSDKYLSAHPATAKAFIQAVQKGYEYAVAHPDAAAALLIKANPSVLDNSKQLVKKSAELLATNGYFQVKGRVVGSANPTLWNKFGAFLIKNGLVKDKSGKTLKTVPNWSTYYTNQYLAK